MRNLLQTAPSAASIYNLFGIFVGLVVSVASAQPSSNTLVTTAVSPSKVELRDDGVFFIDFGRDAFAKLKVHLDNTAGQKITVCLGEKLSDPDHIDAKPGGSIRFLETTCSAGLATLTKADARKMPPDVGPVMPFRYVELKGVAKGTTTEKISKAITQEVVNYPFDDNAAEFSCSDSQLNAVWNLCKYSIKVTSYAGIFVDGDRERTPYEADAYINGLDWYCCTTDLTLPALSDRYLIDHPTWPTEWSMFSVLCAWNDYLYTGHRDALRTIYPDLKSKSLLALEREDGLISTAKVPPALTRSLHLARENLKDIVDWPISERDGYEMVPVNTVVNAFHCLAMEKLSKIAAAVGNQTDAKEFQHAADKARASLNKALFDASTGLYVDGEGSTHSSQHANMFPLAFGLVPPDRQSKVLAFVKSRGMACSVYGAQFLMDSLFDNGAANNAIDLMLAPGDRSWRHMVEDTGTTISLEAWDQKYKPNQDWNHAWGAAPANLIPRKVLGVEPLEPGFTKAIIFPRCASASGRITWAKGKVPTAKGPILVEWKSSAERFQMSLTLPATTTAQILLPRDWGNHLTLDQTIIKNTGNDEHIPINVGSGSHVILIIK